MTTYSLDNKYNFPTMQINFFVLSAVIPIKLNSERKYEAHFLGEPFDVLPSKTKMEHFIEQCGSSLIILQLLTCVLS